MDFRRVEMHGGANGNRNQDESERRGRHKDPKATDCDETRHLQIQNPVSHYGPRELRDRQDEQDKERQRVGAEKEGTLDGGDDGIRAWNTGER